MILRCSEYLNDDVNHIHDKRFQKMIGFIRCEVLPPLHFKVIPNISFIKQDVDGNNNLGLMINEDAFKRINIESILIERNQKLTESDISRG